MFCLGARKEDIFFYVPALFFFNNLFKRNRSISIQVRVLLNSFFILRTVRTTQNYNSIFPFISLYFALDQKRATFASLLAEHIHIVLPLPKIYSTVLMSGELTAIL